MIRLEVHGATASKSTTAVAATEKFPVVDDGEGEESFRDVFLFRRR